MPLDTIRVKGFLKTINFCRIFILKCTKESKILVKLIQVKRGGKGTFYKWLKFYIKDLLLTLSVVKTIKQQCALKIANLMYKLELMSGDLILLYWNLKKVTSKLILKKSQIN